MLSNSEMISYRPPSNHLSGRIILITGAGSGIGKAAAFCCAQAGAKVILAGRTTETLEATYSLIVENNYHEPSIYPLDLEGASTSDYEILSELTTFIQKSNSFEAEEGCNDDLAMCLVIYAWLVAQDYFKELTDQDVRKRLYEEQKNQIEQDMAPFGFMVDGLDAESEVDSDGDRWFQADEYGDKSYMWEYMS